MASKTVIRPISFSGTFTLQRKSAETYVVEKSLYVCWFPGRGDKRSTRKLSILYLHKSHNTPLLPPKICIGIVFDFHVPGEIANNGYAKVLGVIEVYYGIVQVVNRLRSSQYFFKFRFSLQPKEQRLHSQKVQAEVDAIRGGVRADWLPW